MRNDTLSVAGTLFCTPSFSDFLPKTGKLELAPICQNCQFDSAVVAALDGSGVTLARKMRWFLKGGGLAVREVNHPCLWEEEYILNGR